MLGDINRSASFLAGEIEGQITPQDKAAWERGSIEDWVLQSHRPARRVAYRDLGGERPPIIGQRYEREVDPVVELQLERAGVRLAYVLDQHLRWVSERTA